MAMRRGTSLARCARAGGRAHPSLRHSSIRAPVTGRLVYVRAVEALQRWEPATATATLRAAALALERAQNQLWWLVRFARLLTADPLAARTYSLAAALAEFTSTLWEQPPEAWIVPRGGAAPARTVVMDELRRVARGVAGLATHVARAPLLALRTRHVGILSPERLTAAGASGPVLDASAHGEHGAADVWSRPVTRTRSAARDLRLVAELLTTTNPDRREVTATETDWRVPAAGQVQARLEGPRGQLGLTLASDGTAQPSRVEWQRPSARLLPLVPDLLAGQKLADAEEIVASLDLAMAEADG